MPLLRLANELLSCISESLDYERDINAFAQTNRYLYNLLNKALYRHNIQHSKCSALQWAARHGQEETARKLLRELHDGSSNNDLTTALCLAAEKGHEDVVKLLLDNGTDVNIVNPVEGEFCAALELASENGHARVAKLLLDRGADIDARSRYYHDKQEEFMEENALYATAKRGQEEVLKLLLDYGADVSAEVGECGNALQVAVAGGYEQLVELLLAYGADVNMQGCYYLRWQYEFRPSSALCKAAELGNKQIVKLLLERGANVNTKNGMYGSALLAAVHENHEDIVKLLLDNGASVNAQGEYFDHSRYEFDNVGALHIASAVGHEKIVTLLLNHEGININLQGGIYGNALQVAASFSNRKIVKLLLERGANANAQGGIYGNALHTAASCGKGEIVRLLLEKGADVFAQDQDHRNALEAALAYGHEEVAQIIRDKEESSLLSSLS